MTEDDLDNGDQKRQTRGEALKGRLSSGVNTPEESETEDTSKTTEVSKASKTEETPEIESESADEKASKTVKTPNTSKAPNTAEADSSSETEETPTRERKNVNMYLPEELIDELDLVFDELNLDLKRDGHDPMEKNRHYRALVLALGLEEVRDMEADDVREALQQDDRIDGLPSA